MDGLRDGEDRFRLVCARPADMEAYLKEKCAYYQKFNEENHVIQQLGKSIINNSREDAMT